MKKFVALLIASAAMVATAYAGEVEGVVKAFDPATKTVPSRTARPMFWLKALPLKALLQEPRSRWLLTTRARLQRQFLLFNNFSL